MALVSATKIVIAGVLVENYAAVNASDTFIGGLDRFLQVWNDSVSSINVTINSIEPCTHGFDHNLVVAVPAGGTKMIGPFPARYQDANGIVTVTYSATPDVTAGVFEL